MKVAIQPPEPMGEDASGAFEHGPSERALAGSNSSVGAGGASEAAVTSLNSNNDDDFFDAFVNAAGPQSLGGGAGLGEPAAQTTAPSTEPGWTEVDLFSDFAAGATAEAANRPTPMHKKGSNFATNQSDGFEADPFGAFNDVDTDQPHFGADNAISVSSAAQKDDAEAHVNAPEDDDFFVAFGAAGEAGYPPVANQSGARDGLGVNEGTNPGSPEKEDGPTTEKSEADKNEMNGTHASDGFGDFDGDPQTNEGGDSGFALTGGDSLFHENVEGGSSSQKDTPDILPIQTNENSQGTTGIVRGDNAEGSESRNKTFLGDLPAVSLSADMDVPETEPQPQTDGTAPQVSEVNNKSATEGRDAVLDAPKTSLENTDGAGGDFGGFAAFGGTASYAIDVCDLLTIASFEEAPPPVAAPVNDDDVGAFASLAESPSNPPAGEEAPDSQPASDGAGAVSAIENGEKDNVALSDGVAVTVSNMSAVDIVAGNDCGAGEFSPFDEGIPLAAGLEEGDQDGTLANAPYAEVEEDADSGGLVSVEEVPADRPSSVESLAVDNGFGNFKGIASPDAAAAEAEVPASRPAAAAISAADDEFGDFDALEGAPGEFLPDDEPAQNDERAPVPAEEGTATIQPLSVEESVNETDGELGDFGGFNAFEETPEEVLLDGESTENDENVRAPAEDGALESQPSEGTSSANYNADGAEGDFGGFGGFNAFEGTPEETSPDDVQTEDDKKMLTAEGECLESRPSAVESAANDADDEFGDFGDFDAFEAKTLSDQKAPPPAEEETQAVQPPAAASSENGADDEFGDFGDFDALEEAPAEASPDVARTETEEKAPAPAEKEAPASQPSAAGSSVNNADDEFGDFGDFDAFEEAPPADAAPLEIDQHAPIPAEEEAPASQPPAVAVSADEDDDGFGDFGDFEEFQESHTEEPLLDDSPPTQSDEKRVPKPAEPPALSILNERINSMFHDVFATDPRIASDFVGKGTCSELPFNVPMRKVLSTHVAPKDKDTTQTAQSECKLDLMKTYFQGLPRSPPLTILSDEKWYPYSQYEFQRDGSPRADATERSTTPSVPEVLSIDLPTGFEATNLAPRSNTPPPSSSDRTAQTVVDFPSTPQNNQSTVVALPPKLQSEESEVNNVSNAQQGSAASEELDCSQLSATGKQFMEQLPDLSYMLKSTLSLPNDKK